MQSSPETKSWIVGVDCAVQAQHAGIALARWDGTRAQLQELHCGPRGSLMSFWGAEVIGPWLGRSEPVLLALDAPLGWPQPLAQALQDHRAGEPLRRKRPGMDSLFRRRTDEFIKERLGKSPLEVGADRIARTATAALDLIGALREQGPHSLPLAWHPRSLVRSCVIEVYPAATLRAYPGLDVSGYKKKEGMEQRKTILRAVSDLLDLGSIAETAERLCLENDHALDAVLCTLAGQDFLKGEVLAPKDGERDLIAGEGWIWTKASPQ